VEITEIQAPGKKMMEARAFLNGCVLPVGARFSS
jgi:methionyl-tRNA formyltransferase